MVNRIQDKELCYGSETGAEMVELVFSLVFAVGLGAALLAIQAALNDMLDSVGNGAAQTFNEMAKGGAVELDPVTYGGTGE